MVKLMASIEKKISIYKKIRGVSRLLGAITLPLAIAFWVFPNQGVYALIFSILTGVFIIGYSILSVLINKGRASIKKVEQPRIGHQGEPGAWRCECGRYNTSYRFVCLSCGAKKPNTIFD